MELIIESQLLFLDEPTTELDAYTAVSVAEKSRKTLAFLSFFIASCLFGNTASEGSQLW